MRIWRQDQVGTRVVGVGFLVTDRHVMTCAHVVSQALLGTTQTPPSPPPGVLSLDFPLLDAPQTASQVRVAFWGPTDGMGDIAVLELDGVPAGARPVRLENVPNLFHHRFRAFGFPNVKEGRWAVGELLDREASGWVQLQHQEVTGFRVQPGYSGGPVWDEELQCVVGMVVASVSGEAANSLRTGFAIPTALLVKAWPRAGSLIVTGAQNVLLQGIRSLPTDYAGRIQDFLDLYFGTKDQPVPFGGRGDDLAWLDSWLDGPQQPPYLLLAAPAGRGKSALLVRWAQSLLQRQDLAVIFFPVSVRFGTNLASVVFASLAARLAALHGGKVPGDANTPAEVWRGLLRDYLSRPLPDGRRLLVVLDALDEAADWKAGAGLFPLGPPGGLRVVVTARYRAGDTGAQSWLRRLGWDRPRLADARELARLSREGVANVLRRMGCPLDRLGGRVDVVAELHRLSEGDPLLVGLYVEDLWKKGEAATRLQPEDLRAIRPGLEGYLERWWEEQERLWGEGTLENPLVRFLLKVLAFAQGPLSQKDLLRLARLALPGASIDSILLGKAVPPLSRLVIGDGRDQGFVFSHPRLGIHFSQKFQEDREEVEALFLAWGREVLEALNGGRLPPGEASRYLVQYYGAHLEGAGVGPEALLGLVSEGWRRAWEALEGSYSGFLTDVGRAWAAARKANQEQARGGERPFGGARYSAPCVSPASTAWRGTSPRNS